MGNKNKLTTEEVEDLERRLSAGQTAAKIAADLGISLPAAKARIHRIRHKKRKPKTDVGAGRTVELPKPAPEYRVGQKVKVVFKAEEKEDESTTVGVIEAVYKHYYVVKVKNYRTTILKSAINNLTCSHTITEIKGE